LAGRLKRARSLQHFVDAQEAVYEQVTEELTAGEKRSHWMWFIFPQLIGLGHSAMAKRYAIADRSQAASYLAHPVLGTRLRECVRLINSHQDRTAAQIFGYPDDLKLHSSLTLFHDVDPSEPLFTQALDRFYGGSLDEATRNLLHELKNP
jgi:uncharacterized protein (DUF1810 family)